MQRGNTFEGSFVSFFGIVEVSNVVLDFVGDYANAILLFGFAPRNPLVSAGIVGVLSGVHLILTVGCYSEIATAIVECLFLVYVVYLHSLWIAHDEPVHQHVFASVGYLHRGASIETSLPPVDHQPAPLRHQRIIFFVDGRKKSAR